jgi:WD40 repeat protein
MWDLSDGAIIYSARPHSDVVCQIIFAADGALFATLSADGTAKTSDAESGRLLASMQGHKLMVLSGAFLTHDRLASTGYDRTIRIWDVQSGLQLAQMVGHERSVRWLDVSPDKRWIVTCSHDGTVRVWPADGGDARTAPAHAGRIRDLAYSQDSRILYSLGTDGSLNAWRTHDLQKLASTTVSEAAQATLSFALSPDDRFLAVGSPDGVIRLLDARTLALASVIKPSKAQDASLESPQNFGQFVAFSPDGEQLITGGWAGGSEHAWIWDLDRGQVERELPVAPSPVWAVAWSPNGRIAATGSENGIVEIWDPDTGGSLGQVATFNFKEGSSEAGDNPIMSLEFSRSLRGQLRSGQFPLP